MPLDEFQRRLLEWYARCRRSLPWRGRSDPYEILVAEFMLQQTGVERVRPIYERFLTLFPTFQALADAPRIEVLRAWAGLGYNRRAVNLQECAKAVVDEHDGQLPRDQRALRRLPGIGPYTLAAIQSFAFHEDVAAVDTNVVRVVGRVVSGPRADPKETTAVAATLVPPGASADWNQALMDLGASICTVARPKCSSCPVALCCASAAEFEVSRPVRQVAEKPEPYLGSRRFLRGRIVAFLREREPGSVVSLVEVARTIFSEPTDADLILTEELAQALAIQGLAHRLSLDGTTFLGPPR